MKEILINASAFEKVQIFQAHCDVVQYSISLSESISENITITLQPTSGSQTKVVYTVGNGIEMVEDGLTWLVSGVDLESREYSFELFDLDNSKRVAIGEIYFLYSSITSIGSTSAIELLKGDKGDAFEYSDFTASQLAALKGDKGEAFQYSDFTPSQLEDLKGDKGDAFVYSDFTPSQLEALKGDAFEYSDFTPSQLAALKGDAFVYADFTASQLAALKGDKGDAFQYSDFTPSQLEELKGNKGDAFEYSDFTPSQLEALKGDAFEYSDFTPSQIAALKGDPFVYADFTASQIAALKGDPFVYADFTASQIAALKGDAFVYADFTASQLADLKGDTFEYSDLTNTQKDDLRQGMQPITVANTSSVVSFETNTIKGTAAQPITNTLTLNLTGALMGSVVTVWYSGLALPSFVDKWLNGSDAEFAPSTLCLFTFHLHPNNYIVAIHNT